MYISYFYLRYPLEGTSGYSYYTWERLTPGFCYHCNESVWIVPGTIEED